ncbi:MAG: DUF4192 domain-containing protein [Actinomadura sp.]
MTNHAPGGDRPPMVIRTPADLVSAVPYLLGFHPEDSLVVIGSGGPHGTCALRIDLPPAGVAAEAIADRFAQMLRRNDFPHAMLVGYGSADRVTPLIDAARPALAECEVELHDALRVTGGRFWSYLCSDPDCCPVEGTPFDVATSIVAAQATFAGQVALAGRAELARTVAPLGGIARESMREATGRAENRLFEVFRAESDAARVRSRMAEEGLPFLRELLARTGRGGRRPSDDEIAWLGVVLGYLRVRDEAWVRIDLTRPEAHIAFWRDVLCRVEEQYAAAPACLLAYAAFAAGNGGLANVALERAFDADPDYSMARLLHGLISTGAPPSSVRLPMTPDDLATAYGEYDDPETDRRAS